MNTLPSWAILVGARYDDRNAGAGYIFERGQDDIWRQTAKLVPPEGGFQDFLGESVALHGDIAVLGATGDDDTGGDSGSASVFVR